MSTLPKIIAVDFDGTLFENAWPDVGAPIEKNINKLKAEQADGAKVILWTNRVGGALDKAVNFCKEHGIHLDAIILWELHTQLGLGPKRLKKFFDGFSDALNALVNRYEMDISDDVWLCTHKLKEIGVDVEDWYRQKE